MVQINVTSISLGCPNLYIYIVDTKFMLHIKHVNGNKILLYNYYKIQCQRSHFFFKYQIPGFLKVFAPKFQFCFKFFCANFQVLSYKWSEQ